MTAWLMQITQKRKRVSEGYDDHASTHYSWDSAVPNHAKPQSGDIIVIWTPEKLLGLSVIDRITKGEATKQTSMCPYCGKADVAPRKKKTPKYKCWTESCREEFDEPAWKTKEVVTYQSRHEMSWISADGLLTGRELRHLCFSPWSQNAIRELDWKRFTEALDNSPEPISLSMISAAQKSVTGTTDGHKIATTRVRRGQGTFRKKLLEHFGETCAFTGHTPPQALDAAHLYSYADNGKHHENGGLLLRRDLHRLFDLGLISVNPKNNMLDLSEELMIYPTYSELQGSWVKVDITPDHVEWIERHWSIHRENPPNP